MKPIIFTGDAVPKIIAGTKTQTRRVIKPQPELLGDRWRWEMSRHTFVRISEAPNKVCLLPCPYGVPDDRFYASESVVILETDAGAAWIEYADGTSNHVEIPTRIKYPGVGRYRGRIIPHEWSRATATITDVRVQRVQEISEEDAIAEGIRTDDCDWVCGKCRRFALHTTERACPDCGSVYSLAGGTLTLDYIEQFRKLWDSLNAERGFGWDANPWVWALTFERS